MGYRMKLVFAHFPVNVQIANDKKSMDIVNFIGQKVKFHVDCHDGCQSSVTPSPTLRSSSAGTTSRMSVSHALASRNRALSATRISVSSLMVSTSCPRATLSRMKSKLRLGVNLRSSHDQVKAKTKPKIERK